MNKEKFELFALQSQVQRQRYWVEKNNFTEQEANEKARSEFTNILSDGLETKDNFVYNLVDVKKSDVGYLWYTLRTEGSYKKAFICDFFVEETLRLKGYGKCALELLEQEVLGMGLDKIGLHAFADNDAAIGLYKSVGYKVKSVFMDKDLS